MATGGEFRDTAVKLYVYSESTESDLSNTESDESFNLDIVNVSDSDASGSPSSEPLSEAWKSSETRKTPRSRDLQPSPVEEVFPTPSAHHPSHASCPSGCRKRQFHAVIHCSLKDTALAHSLQGELKEMTLTYLGKKYQVRVQLLSDVTNKTETESLAAIRQEEMTKVIILLVTDNYILDKHSQTTGLKIINSASSSSFDVIELYTDIRVMDKHNSGLVQRVLYDPKSPAFMQKMTNILMSGFDNEQVQHDKLRRDCEEKERRNQRCKNNHRAKVAPLAVLKNKEATTTESDSSVALLLNTFSADGRRHEDVKRRSSHSKQTRPPNFRLRHQTDDPLPDSVKEETADHMPPQLQSYPCETTVSRYEPLTRPIGHHVAEIGRQSQYVNSTALSCYEEPSKQTISHFRRPSAAHTHENSQTNRLSCLSASCSSSSDAHYKSEAEIKSDSTYRKEFINAISTDKDCNQNDMIQTYARHCEKHAAPESKTTRGEETIHNDGHSYPNKEKTAKNDDSVEERTKQPFLTQTTYAGNSTLDSAVSTSASGLNSVTTQQNTLCSHPSAGVMPQQSHATSCSETVLQTWGSSGVSEDLSHGLGKRQPGNPQPADEASATVSPESGIYTRTANDVMQRRDSQQVTESGNGSENERQHRRSRSLTTRISSSLRHILRCSSSKSRNMLQPKTTAE